MVKRPRGLCSAPAPGLADRHRLGLLCGIKIHVTRIIRLLEVLLHAGNNLGGWSAKHIHQVILQSFQLSEKSYGLNQFRYDLRKLKGHGLIERDGSRYAYRLTSKGFQVALLFLSSTSVCVVHLLTVAFTTNQTPTIGPRANLKLPIIRLTGPSKTLSISSMLRDTAARKSSTNYVYDFGGKNLVLRPKIRTGYRNGDDGRCKPITGRHSARMRGSISCFFARRRAERAKPGGTINRSIAASSTFPSQSPTPIG